MYSDNDFISKPSTTEQNISFNNKNKYLNKILSKETNQFNNKNKNHLTEAKIQLKKSKQKKNPNHQTNRNSVNYAKFINSIVISKESLIDKAKKSKRHFSANQGTKIKNKNTLNKESWNYNTSKISNEANNSDIHKMSSINMEAKVHFPGLRKKNKSSNVLISNLYKPKNIKYALNNNNIILMKNQSNNNSIKLRNIKSNSKLYDCEENNNNNFLENNNKK
jgi:hypothetical protein